MYTFALIYLAFGTAALIALAVMILRIGAMMAGCPQTGPAVRVSAVTIATGFAAIGMGGVILVGVLVPILADAPLIGLMLSLGLVALTLGLGFTQAVGTLRALVDDAAAPRPADA